MQSSTKSDILSNTFAKQLRSEWRVDESEYVKLVAAVTQLSEALKGKPTIDKQIMLDLYGASQIVRTTYETLFKSDPESEIAHRLVAMWCELDDLITECLNS